MPTTSPQRTLPTRLAAGAAGVLLLLGTAAAAVVALGSPAAAAAHAVMIQHYAYSPAALTVDQGDTVTWTNHDSVQHDVMVTSGPATFHSPMLAQGQSWSFTFTVPGAYSYVCSVHPDMRASVTLRPKSTPAPMPAHMTKAQPATAAPSTAAAPTGKTHAGKPSAGTSAQGAAPAPAATQAAAPAATQAITATPAATTASLDPLLLVAGASTAVMVFCLLLMTSRPVGKATEATEATETVEPVEADA